MDTIPGLAELMLGDGLAHIEGWHACEMYTPSTVARSQDGGLLMGCPVWSRPYLERFLRLGIPSLLTAENREALTGARIILYLDPRDDAGLRDAVRLRLQEHFAVEVRLMPQQILARMAVDRRLTLAMLGTVHSILRHTAGQRGCDFHMLQPDHHYGRGFFAALRRLGRCHDAIVQSGLSATLDVSADLEAWLARGGAPAAELGALGFRHLHPQQRWMILNACGRNTETALPRSNWLAWRGRDELVVHNAHMHLTYLSAGLCRAARPTAPHTTDTRLPWLMSRFYVPEPRDGLVFLELSGSGKRHSEEAIDFRAWALNWWQIALFKPHHLPFFATPCRVPVGHDPGGMSRWAIRRQASRLVKRLRAARVQAMEDFIEAKTGA